MGLTVPPVPSSSCGCYLSPSSHSQNEFSPVSGSTPPSLSGAQGWHAQDQAGPTGRGRGQDPWPSTALLAAGRCTEVVQGCDSCRGMQVALGHSCRPQGSFPSVAEDSEEEKSSFVLLTPVLLPCHGPHPQCRTFLLQQHPSPHPSWAILPGASPQAALAKPTAPAHPGCALG